MKSKEEDEIFREIGEVFSRHKLYLSDISKICEDLSACVLHAQMNQMKKEGIPLNRKSRRLLKL